VTPLRQVGIAADLTEPIGDVDVQEGQTVRAGQVLAHLLTDDLEAQLASSERVTAEDVARYAQAAYQTNAVNAQDDSAVRSAQDNLHQARVFIVPIMYRWIAPKELVKETVLTSDGPPQGQPAPA
jgi:multidrug efflux pump subunit AcrA (membrane-fusion protein)